MAKEPLYSEAEIAEIVRRAAELQEEGSIHGYVPGVTGQELARMAAEVGIDPIYLERAITEQRAGQGSRSKAPRRLEIERVFPVEIRPENFDLITDSVKIMPATSYHGATSGGMTQVGRSLQGQVSGGWENPHFKITSRGGRTKLNVWSTNSTAIGLSFLWIVPLCISPVVGAVAGAMFGTLSALATVAGCILSFRWLTKKGQEATREAAKKLESAILRAAEEVDLRSELSRASTPTESFPEGQEVREIP